MLRTNLSSRPFYNERLTSFVIAVVGVIAIGLLQEAEKNAPENDALQKTINAKTLKGLALSTQQANALIDERTFSWTVFFGLIEKTLPNDVRVVSVTPVIDKNGVLVMMSVVSKRPDDLSTFIEGLQGTGAFYDVLPRQEDSTEDGMRRATLEARYLPPVSTGKPAAKPADKPAETPAEKPTPKPPAPVPAKKGGGL